MDGSEIDLPPSKKSYIINFYKILVFLTLLKKTSLLQKCLSSSGDKMRRWIHETTDLLVRVQVCPTRIVYVMSTQKISQPPCEFMYVTSLKMFNDYPGASTRFKNKDHRFRGQLFIIFSTHSTTFLPTKSFSYTLFYSSWYGKGLLKLIL